MAITIMAAIAITQFVSKLLVVEVGDTVGVDVGLKVAGMYVVGVGVGVVTDVISGIIAGKVTVTLLPP